jgi:hypothetical protein
VEQLVAKLERAGAVTDPAALSDSRMLESRYENVPHVELARVFGEDFADALFKQPTERWLGPIASGYGVHLVRLDSKTPGGVAALEEVWPLVEREWSNAKRKELRETFYGQLRGKYRVTVSMPAASAVPAAKPLAAGRP